MSEHSPDASRRAYTRAQDPEEPGAHSGSESQARERVIPGTASASEGYHQAGTDEGDSLSGVRAPQDTGAATGSPASAVAVSPEQVPMLLDPAGQDSCLVLIEGRTEVVPAAQAATDRYEGAVQVATGRDLADLVGSTAVTPEDMSALAARLQAMAAQLGA
ncbi:hypothetical protein ACFWUW_29235 [Streptomyces sp. NPDC058655]|uniref:hypothetical protein n=1 Tax=Streptomyces sp. NPDC058655 TaxID=3346577 RepID=UPI00366252A3